MFGTSLGALIAIIVMIAIVCKIVGWSIKTIAASAPYVRRALPTAANRQRKLSEQLRAVRANMLADVKVVLTRINSVVNANGELPLYPTVKAVLRSADDYVNDGDVSAADAQELLQALECLERALMLRADIEKHPERFCSKEEIDAHVNNSERVIEATRLIIIGLFRRRHADRLLQLEFAANSLELQAGLDADTPETPPPPS